VSRQPRRRLAITLVATAALLPIALLISQGVAEAGVRYTTKTATIPSGGNGAAEPGGGSRIANKAFGYYIGRVMPGGTFVKTGGRANHVYGRITGPGVNVCGWLHKSALAGRDGRQDSSCSRGAANKMWQRTTFGKRFSAPAGTKGHSGVPVAAKAGCPMFYNYFTDSQLRRGTLRDQAGGTIGTGGPRPGTVKYRFVTRDGKAVVIFDDVLGWGFTRPDCVNMNGLTTFNDSDKGSPPRF
jgi:hypothetical protein